MKLVKSLMLGSVAGLAAVAGAQAADLPVKKAAPVEYVRVCTTYGAGFFYIPGTDTCLRVGGRVRAQYLYTTPQIRAQDATGFYTRGRVQLDARTATAYGLLRTVVRLELTRTTGAFNGVNFNGATTGFLGNPTTGSNVAEAFVQFGGLTAGRVVSFFSNGDLPTGHFGTLRFDDAPDVDLLAYTFTFGNGFSATISLEDGITRRQGLAANFPLPGTSIPVVYAGQTAPDLVGNLKYSGTWGTAQLSGAVHQIRSNNLINFATPFGPVADYPDTKYGFALAFQGSVNLPALAPGDAAWLALQYSNGALGYLNGGNASLNSSPFNLTTAGGFLALADAVVNPVTGDIKNTTAWSIAGGLRHYWIPTIRQNIFGSYMRVNYANIASGITPTGFAFGLDDFNEWRVGSNVIWSPVAGLDLGVEVIYAKVDPKGRLALPIAVQPSNDAIEGRIRVQRDF